VGVSGAEQREVLSCSLFESLASAGSSGSWTGRDNADVVPQAVEPVGAFPAGRACRHALGRDRWISAS